jgi:hypothetical protein
MHKTDVSWHSRISIRRMSCESILPRLTKTSPRDRPARHKHLVSSSLDKGYLFSKLTGNESVKVESRVSPTLLVRRKKVTIFISSPKIPDVHLFA